MSVDVTVTNARDAIIAVAAVLVAFGAIWRGAVRPTIRFCQRVEHVMQSVEEQLYPNHGSSLRDAVTEIQNHLGIVPHLPDTNPPEARRQEAP